MDYGHSSFETDVPRGCAQDQFQRIPLWARDCSGAFSMVRMRAGKGAAGEWQWFREAEQVARAASELGSAGLLFHILYFYFWILV